MSSDSSWVVGFGIVTALPVEFAAAQQLLERPRPITLPHDPGQYLLGQLPSSHRSRPHTVALTVLPRDGTRSAAAACTSLLAGFPSIRAVVMVGIAGGIPAPEKPDKHVRLGDIVVADEIIDYGHLRAVDGSQELRRRLDHPGIDLVNADRMLQAGEAAGHRPWETHLGSAEPVPRSFARPTAETDILIVGGQRVAHPDDSAYGRRDGYPRVHHGIVASGDQLVRDVAERDRLARKYQVCALEMEGAGIAAGSTLRSVPWFMVRGIADYCDNAAKNDIWHPYASLVAAAYLRALLAQCAPLASHSSVAVPSRRDGRSASIVNQRSVNRPEDSQRSAIQQLRAIVDALLDISALLAVEARRTLIAALPRNIQTSIPEQSSARYQIISIVRTCSGFHGGKEALLAALQTSVGHGSRGLAEAEEAIHDNWDGLNE